MPATSFKSHQSHIVWPSCEIQVHALVNQQRLDCMLGGHTAAPSFLVMASTGPNSRTPCPGPPPQARRRSSLRVGLRPAGCRNARQPSCPHHLCEASSPPLIWGISGRVLYNVKWWIQFSSLSAEARLPRGRDHTRSRISPPLQKLNPQGVHASRFREGCHSHAGSSMTQIIHKMSWVDVFSRRKNAHTRTGHRRVVERWRPLRCCNCFPRLRYGVPRYKLGVA